MGGGGSDFVSGTTLLSVAFVVDGGSGDTSLSFDLIPVGEEAGTGAGFVS